MALSSPPLELPAAPAVDDARVRFEAIYRHELAWVVRTVERLGARPRDLEDLVQDVFVAFYRTMDGYDPTRPLRPWLFGIAFRVISDYRRKASFAREAPDQARAEEASVVGPTPVDSLEAAEKRRLVLSALDALPLDQRAIFVAVELDERAVPEVAADLGIPLNTAYSRLRLGRQRFAAAVERLSAHDGGAR
jgi:RNA polymerase sigma-70 factor (ECF subfamily)